MRDANSIRFLFEANPWLDEAVGPLFAACPDGWETRMADVGEIVCEQEQELDAFQIVVCGELKVEHTLDNGETYALAHLYPGDVIGDIELVLRKPSLGRVRSLTCSTLLKLRAEKFQRLLARDVPTLQYVCSQLANKLYSTSLHSAENTVLSLRQRFFRFLYEHVESVDFNAQIAYILPLSREDAARQFGVTVRSVNRILKELKDKRIIYLNKNVIIMNESSRFMLRKEIIQS